MLSGRGGTRNHARMNGVVLGSFDQCMRFHIVINTMHRLLPMGKSNARNLCKYMFVRSYINDGNIRAPEYAGRICMSSIMMIIDII